MGDRKYAGRSPEERSSERIARLMDTAIALFGSHGYAATTIGMLCAESNVSTRHFYREIGSRSELLKKIVTTMNEDGEHAAREALTADGRQPVLASIDAAIRAYLGVTCRTRMSARVCYVEVVGVSTDIELWRMNQRDAIVEMFDSLATTAAARGELPYRNYRLVILAIIGAANIFAQEWALSRSCDVGTTDDTFTPYIDTLVELVTAALTTPLPDRNQVRTMLLLALAVVLVLTSFVRIRRDPRRLSNGLTVIAALAALAIGSLSLLHRLDARVEAILVVAVLSAILLTAIGLVGAAAINGLVVIRREGLRLSTALPLALAVAVTLGVGLFVAVAAVLETHTLPLWLLAAVWTGVLFSVCLGVQLAAFSVHALIYGHLEPPKGSSAVVALGCGLGSGGTVTPLLESRLNRALDVYNAEVASGHRPALVVSGGQGSDEETAEATAMKKYLVSKGVSKN